MPRCRAWPRQTGNERFAYDSYRRFVQMFGKIVLDVPGEDFEEALQDLMEERGVTVDTALSGEDLIALVGTFKGIVKSVAGVDFPGGSARAARVRDRSGVQVVERSAGARLPPNGTDP